MTYCCGILVADGLVMIADTRTNAGLDDISTYRKLHLFHGEGRHAIADTTACTSFGKRKMSSISSPRAWRATNRSGRGSLGVTTIDQAPNMYAVAQLVGRAARQVRRIDTDAYQQESVAFQVTFLIGGQVGNERPRLFMVYSAGNFIECSPDAPFLQVGEHSRNHGRKADPPSRADQS